MIDVQNQPYPLQLFCPAENWQNPVSIQTPRELQLLLDVAFKMNIPYRLNSDTKKFFYGHDKDWRPKITGTEKAPTNTASTKPHDGKAYVRVMPILPQHYPDSCGQTSVAMAINTLNRVTTWNDDKVHNGYGYGLLEALRKETGKDWTDPNFSSKSWELIEHNLECGYPVLFAANGPDFSASGHGHVLLIYQLDGEGPTGKVYFADPNGGKVTVRSRKQCEDAPPHPQGKWLMVAKAKIG